jgi:hypothetical protein
MPTGFLEPMDVEERRRFAERNGLQWMSAEEAAVSISETAVENRENPFGEDEEDV